MSESKIEWTEHTWNPTAGCSLVSPGCTNCYAMKTARRFDGMGRGYDGTTQPSKGGPVWTGVVNLLPERLSIPLKRKKPTTWFVNSMSDLFHESIPFEYIAAVFGVMAACPQHTFQVLTKRPERAREFFEWWGPHAYDAVNDAFRKASGKTGVAVFPTQRHGMVPRRPWPLENVWLGTSVEDQQRADERIPELLRCPAAVRFLSAEPLLGPIVIPPMSYVDWVIEGGESGPGARPMHPDWARSIRDQCVAAGVPYFHKQNGAWIDEGQIGNPLSPQRHANTDSMTFFGENGNGDVQMIRVGKKAAGRLLDGRTWDEMPGQARKAVAS